MAPKRSKRRVVGVVRSTRKVVKETVEFEILGADTQEDLDATQQQQDTNILVDDVVLTPDQPIVVERQEEDNNEQTTTTVRTNPVHEEEPAIPKVPSLREATKKEKEVIDQEEGGDDKGQKGKKKKKKKRVEGEDGYGRYVYKVMKQVHPEMRISGMAMSVVNSLMKDMFERIADEAATLTSRVSRRRTMSFREVEDAVKLVLPGELGKHAVAEGSKAVANYAAYQKKVMNPTKGTRGK